MARTLSELHVGVGAIRRQAVVVIGGVAAHVQLTCVPAVKGVTFMLRRYAYMSL
jgi:hypothetical protein